MANDLTLPLFGLHTLENFVFANNQFHGQGTGLHFEEAVENVIISGNTFYMGEIAVEMLDNNAGGRRYIPSKFVISNNIMEAVNPIPGRVTAGVMVIWDTSNFAGGVDVVITNNLITKMDRGISIGSEEVNRVKIHGNYITESKVGLLCGGAIPADVKANHFRSCSSVLFHRRGGSTLFYSNNYVG
jgi:nitrous oxidase accessory protein NosD